MTTTTRSGPPASAGACEPDTRVTRSLLGHGVLAGPVYLVADPANGFPRGTPPGPAAHLSWHGMGHLAAGGAGFACLVAACFVVARWFTGHGRPGWAVYSRVTGVAFLVGFGATASGSDSPAAVLAFWAAVTAALAWLSAVSVYAYRHAAA
jgi:hypothetical protein